MTVSLLLHGDGANGSTTIVDSSQAPKTPTVYGNAQISTAQSLFGGASIKFDGAGDYLEYAPHADFDFGAGDFTLECDVYFTGWPALNGTSSYGEALICRDSSAAGQRIFAWYITGTASSLTTIQFFGFDAAGTFEQINASYSFALNTHYRLRLVRSGNLVYFFVNGTLLNAGGTTFTKTLKTATQPLRIGALRGAGETTVFHLNGYLDEVRISNGEALSTASYTLATSAFPDPVPVYIVKPIVRANGEIQISSGFQGGTATSATSTTLTDSAKAFAVNAMVNRVVWITAGTGIGQSRLITANTATGVTIDSSWEITPDATSSYVISYVLADIVTAGLSAYCNLAQTGLSTYIANKSIRLLSGGFLSMLRTSIIFNADLLSFKTDVGSYFQSGRSQYTYADKWIGFDGGSIHYTETDGAFPGNEYEWLGHTRLYATQVGVTGNTSNHIIYINRKDTASSLTNQGVELIDCFVIGAQFCISTTDTVVNTSWHSGGVLVYGQPVNFFGNTLAGRFATDAEVYLNQPNGIGGGDVVDATWLGIINNYAYDLAKRAIAYLWNTTITVPTWKDHFFNWSTAGGHPTTGIVYRGYTVDISVQNTALATVDAVVGVFDRLGDGAVLTGKSAMYPVRASAITLSAGTYTGVVGSGLGLPILYAKYTVGTNDTTLSTEYLYAPFTFKVRKYGYQFLQKAADWTERSKEQITLNTNIFVVASEAVAALIAGVAIDGTAKTITLSATHTLQELYDYSQSWAATTTNVVYDECLTSSDGNNFNLPATWTLIPANYLDYGSKRINGGTIRFDTAGTYAPKVGDTTLKFTAVSGTYALAGADITGTVTLVNTGGGLITVSLAPGVSYINTGPNITVEQVLNESLAITNLVPGSTVYVVTDNGTVIANEVVAGTSTSYALTSGNTAGATYLTVRVRKATGSPAYQPWQTQTANLLSQSLFVQQELDE